MNGGAGRAQECCQLSCCNNQEGYREGCQRVFNFSVPKNGRREVVGTQRMHGGERGRRSQLVLGRI